MPARKSFEVLPTSTEGSGKDGYFAIDRAGLSSPGSGGGRKTLIRLCLLPLAALLIQSGCSPAATPTLQLELLTPVSECFPHYRVLVWDDVNGDGVLDLGEAPLVGVPVNLRRVGHPNQTFPGQTGPDGIADLNGIGDFGRYCDEIEIEVIVPEGFQHTAPTPAPADLIGLPPGAMLKFGLMPAEGTAAP